MFIYVFRLGDDQNVRRGCDFVSNKFNTTVQYFLYLFWSSNMHQSITQLGCQAIDRSSAYIFAFCTFHFL